MCSIEACLEDRHAVVQTRHVSVSVVHGACCSLKNAGLRIWEGVKTYVPSLCNVVVGKACHGHTSRQLCSMWRDMYGAHLLATMVKTVCVCVCVCGMCGKDSDPSRWAAAGHMDCFLAAVLNYCWATLSSCAGAAALLRAFSDPVDGLGNGPWRGRAPDAA